MAKSSKYPDDDDTDDDDGIPIRRHSRKNRKAKQKSNVILFAIVGGVVALLLIAVGVVLGARHLSKRIKNDSPLADILGPGPTRVPEKVKSVRVTTAADPRAAMLCLMNGCDKEDYRPLYDVLTNEDRIRVDQEMELVRGRQRPGDDIYIDRNAMSNRDLFSLEMNDMTVRKKGFNGWCFMEIASAKMGDTVKNGDEATITLTKEFQKVTQTFSFVKQDGSWRIRKTW